MRHRFAFWLLIGLSSVCAEPGLSHAQERGAERMAKKDESRSKPQPITPETVAAEIYLRPELKARLLEAARAYLNKPETAEKIQNLVWEKQTDLIVPLFRSKDPQGKPAIDPGALLMPVDEKGEPLGTDSALAVRIPAGTVGVEMQVHSIRHTQPAETRDSLIIEAELESATIAVPNVDFGVAYRKDEKEGFDQFRTLPVSAQGTSVDTIAASVEVRRPVVRFEVWMPPAGLAVQIKNLEVEIPPGGVTPILTGLPNRVQVGTSEGGKIGVSLPPSTLAKITRELEAKVGRSLEATVADPEFRKTVLSKAEGPGTDAAQAALRNLEVPIPLNIRKKVSVREVPQIISQELLPIRAWDKRPMVLRTLAKRVAIEGLIDLAQDMAEDIKELPAGDPSSTALVLLAEELRRYFLARFPALALKLPQWADAKSIALGDQGSQRATVFLSELAAALAEEKDKLALEVRDFRMIQRVSVLRNRFLGPEVVVKLSSESRLRDSFVTANIYSKGLNTTLLRGNISCSPTVERGRRVSQVRFSLDASNELFRHLYEEDPDVFNDLIPGGFKFLRAPVLTGVPGTSKVRLVIYGEQPGTDLGGIREDAKLTFEVEGEVQPTVDGTGLRVEALKLIRASEKRFTIERLGNPVNWLATQIFNVGSLASTGIARGQFKKAKPSLRKEVELELLKSSGGRISAVTFNRDNQMEVSITGKEVNP